MRFSAFDVASVVGGQVVGPDVVFDGVSIDSRSIASHELFVPIVAERDGHDFITAAVGSGARGYLTARAPIDSDSATAIVVVDTQRALTELAKWARGRTAATVVGITGSVGKTSVKDLAAGAIGAAKRTHASERSFNNELGVPITILNAPDDTEVLIVEMGARGIGHVAELCEIARPAIGVVTQVGAVHTSEFGSVAAVAQAKSELISALALDGTAILNMDSPEVAAMGEVARGRVIGYSTEANPRATFTSVAPILDRQLRPSFTVVHEHGQAQVVLQVAGVHQVSNALAAIAIAEAVGVPVDRAAAALASAPISPWRMELATTASGATVINDAYNANAMSVAAALRSLSLLEADRHVAVLGTMAELGDRHDEDHRAMCRLCAELGIELVAFREAAYQTVPVDNFDAAIEAIGALGPDTAILVKASRVAGLEQLAAALLQR